MKKRSVTLLSVFACVGSVLLLFTVLLITSDDKPVPVPNDEAFFAHQSWHNCRDIQGFRWLRDNGFSSAPKREEFIRELFGEPDDVLQKDDGGAIWVYRATDYDKNTRESFGAVIDADGNLREWISVEE